MRRTRIPSTLFAIFALMILLSFAIAADEAQDKKQAEPDWSMNATIIEACSCPMFCQCYFDSKPAAHGEHAGHGGGGQHFCKMNNAFKVNKGNYGDTKLDGAKFWLAG